MRNRLAERFRRKVGELVLEPPERDGAFKEQRFVRLIETDAAGHHFVYAPVFAVFHNKRFAVQCGNQRENAARVGRFRLEVRGNELNIAHQ
ncbi:hypothetical protein SDC9_99506 [bioreactor metagenome]|uniref:Uncharacterized protein n=1 Tax=bioreactor metagenome TaxID=1076179 RepID=A0A645AT50_9ZZZZ